MLDAFVFLRTHGIVHHPWVDDDDFPAGRFNAKGSVSKPGKFDALESHDLRAKEMQYER
jgi:hypothetical protein